MGAEQSKPIPKPKLKHKHRSKPHPASAKDGKHSRLSTRKGIHKNKHNTGPKAATDIPPDNIFVPIQPDNILPHIPIGSQHPAPRTGIIDDGKHPIHTNKFYANAFLGKQNEAIWTQPYSLFWGKDREGDGVIKTWGMCISHVEESELAFGPGDPSPVTIVVMDDSEWMLMACSRSTSTPCTSSL